MAKAFTWFVVLLAVLLTAGPSHAQPSQTGAAATWQAQAQAVMAHPKVRDSLRALEAFQRGQGRGRFLVNLEPALGLKEAPGPLRSEAQKLARRNAVAAARDQALAAMPELPAGVIRYRFDNILAVSLELDPAQLEQVLANPRVRSVDPVFPIHAQLAQGIPLMHADTYRGLYNGQGLAVAVCDTGIDYTNPYLGGGGFPNAKVIGGRDVGSMDNDPMDGQGHGTACAGILAGDPPAPGVEAGDYIGGVAPGAKLYALKITVSDGSQESDSELISRAWDWCVSHQNDDPTAPIMVISTSFGGEESFTGTCDEAAYALTQAAALAVAAGMSLFVSAGNEGSCDGVSWPACISYVNAVGAVYDATLAGFDFWVSQESCAIGSEPSADGWKLVHDLPVVDTVTSYSNSGPQVSVLAPSNHATTLGIAATFRQEFGGTSAACPYAAGAAAALQSAAMAQSGAWLTPGQVRVLLEQTGDCVMDPKNARERPRINLAAAIDRLDDPPETPVGHIDIRHEYRGDLVVRLGVGDPDRPAWSRAITYDWDKRYEQDLVVDTDLAPAAAFLPPSPAQPWFLEVQDTAQGSQGAIEGFSIRYGGTDYRAYGLPRDVTDFRTTTVFIGPGEIAPLPLLLLH